jgi:hypothetical protein
MKALDRTIGQRRDATRAPTQARSGRMAQTSQLADHLACAHFLGLGADRRPALLIANALMESLPDQTARAMGDGAPIAWAWPRRGTSRRYTTLKIVPFAFTAALAGRLRTRRIWRLLFGQR